MVLFSYHPSGFFSVSFGEINRNHLSWGNQTGHSDGESLNKGADSSVLASSEKLFISQEIMELEGRLNKLEEVGGHLANEG